MAERVGVDFSKGLGEDDEVLLRRIGFRRPVSGLTLNVVLPVEGPGGLCMSVVEAVVEDLSIWGVGLVVHGSVAMSAGQNIWVEIEGQRGLARVVYVRQPVDSPGRLHCGVMFADPNPRFMSVILAWLDRVNTAIEESTP